MESDNDKRTRKRVPFVIRMQCKVRDTVIEYPYSQNISMAGVFLRTDSVFPVGTKAEIVITLECGEVRLIVKADCKVTRVVFPNTADSPAGMGVEFTKLTPDGSITLFNIIKRQSGEVV